MTKYRFSSVGANADGAITIYEQDGPGEWDVYYATIDKKPVLVCMPPKNTPDQGTIDQAEYILQTTMEPCIHGFPGGFGCNHFHN